MIRSTSVVLAAAIILAALNSATYSSAGAVSPPAAGAGVTATNDTEGTADRTIAERIAGIRKLLEADRERQDELHEQADHLEENFATASETFTQLDTRLTEAKADASAAKTAADKSARSVKISEIEKEWTPARDRFERIIKQRKAVQEQLGILKAKIELEEEALAKATSFQPGPESSAAKLAPRSDAAPPAAPPTPAGTTASATGLGDTPSGETSQPATSAKPEASLLNSAMGIPLPGSSQTPEANGATAPASVDERAMTAKKALFVKQAKLEDADRDVEFLNRSVDIFERDLASARTLLEAAQAEFAESEQLASAAAAARRDLPENASEEERTAAAAADREAAERLSEARESFRRQTERVTQSEALLERLKQARTKTRDKVESARSEVESARTQLWFWNSPMAPNRVFNWLMYTGPRLLVIAGMILLARWLAPILSRRAIGLLISRKSRGPESSDGRADTLQRVFNNFLNTATVVLGTLALLDQAGINVTVLLGGAAVLGAAIAFGSQNLIKDYFSGFMILVERQYSVGNVVKIGDKSGVVEDISLRTTVLRDEEGAVHFIPHGTITTVSNLTYGWSRAVFNIAISYREDVDRVMGVLLDLAKELRDDEQFGPRMLGQPEMLGVDALGDSAVVIKFLVRTRPLQQWGVKRELLRRIKMRFDKLGIEIPFPQQSVHMQIERDEDQVDLDATLQPKESVTHEG